MDFRHTTAFLFDLDGTLTVDGKALTGAGETLAWLKEHGYSVRICTNTTTMSQQTMSRRLHTAGLPIEANEIFSAPAAAIQYLRRQKVHSCLKLLSPDVKSDFSEFADSESNPEYIVIGDIGEAWDYALMARLFSLTLGGAKLIALHKGKHWLADGRLKLDIGAFITAIEYAADTTALVIGKPSAEFYGSALASIDREAHEVCMIGDDLINDVQGAQNCGIKGILVQTGKYRQDERALTRVVPDLVIGSVLDLPTYLSNFPGI